MRVIDWQWQCSCSGRRRRGPTAQQELAC